MKHSLLLLLSAACLWGQQNPDLGSIEGLVVEAGTQNSVPRARLVLRRTDAPAQARGAIAGDDGRFIFPNVEPGGYTIEAARSGYARPARLQAEPPALTLEKGKRLNGLMVEVERTAVVTGRVLDEAGEPMANVLMSPMQDLPIQGQRRLSSTDMVRTDDRGEYRLFDIPPGEYYLSANIRGVTTPAYTRSQFYPGVANPDDAVQLKLEPGEQRHGVDFRIASAEMKAGVSVAGRLLRPEGMQAQRAQVSLRATSPGVELASTQAATIPKPTGEFELTGVPPGDYLLLGVIAAGNGPRYATRELTVGTSNIAGLDLVPQDPIQLEVKVSVEPATSTLELAGTRVAARSRNPNLPFSGAAVLDDTRSAKMQIMLPSLYDLNVGMQAGDAYLKSATHGGRDVLADGLQISTGEQPPLELLFSATGARLSGAVTDADSNPAVGATVVLLPEVAKSTQRHLYKRVTTDQRGRYLLRGIAPGAYRALAVGKLDREGEYAEGFAEANKERFTSVPIREGEQKSLDLKVARPGPPGGR